MRPALVAGSASATGLVRSQLQPAGTADTEPCMRRGKRDAMMRGHVGYEMYHFLLDENIPDSEKYQAFRVVKGRHTTRSEKFKTLAEANAWVEARRKEDE
jgi:hypothetical protein